LTRALARPIGNGTVGVHWARGKSPATRTRPPPSYWTACTTTHSRRPSPGVRDPLCRSRRCCPAARSGWPGRSPPACGNTSGE